MTASRLSPRRPPLLAVTVFLVCAVCLLACPTASVCAEPVVVQSVLRVYNTSNPPLLNPSAAVVSSSGLLYIADSSGGRVVRLTPGGQVDFVYSSPDASAGWYVTGIDVDSATGTIYLANLFNSQVLAVSEANVVLATYNSSSESLNQPGGVAVDQQGRVYVADTFNRRVVRFDPSFGSGAANVTVVYQGETTLSDVALTSKGEVIAADSQRGRVLKISSEGEVLMEWNTTAPPLLRPSAVCVDSSDNIYIADTGNSRVVQMSATSNTVLAIFNTTDPPLDGPQGVAVDARGVVFVVDSRNQRVVAMQPPTPHSSSVGANDRIETAIIASTVTIGGTALIVGLVVLFVCWRSRVRKLRADGSEEPSRNNSFGVWRKGSGMVELK